MHATCRRSTPRCARHRRSRRGARGLVQRAGQQARDARVGDRSPAARRRRSTPDAIALPAAGAPFGSLQVNTATCTLCLSCVGACPEGALADNPERPQLRFIEKNCVQCGLCANTCPEDAITLRAAAVAGRRGQGAQEPARAARSGAVPLRALRQALRHAARDRGDDRQARRPRRVPGRRGRAAEDVRRLPRDRHAHQPQRSAHHRPMTLPDDGAAAASHLALSPLRATATRSWRAPSCTACWRSCGWRRPTRRCCSSSRWRSRRRPRRAATSRRRGRRWWRRCAPPTAARQPRSTTRCSAASASRRSSSTRRTT